MTGDESFDVAHSVLDRSVNFTTSAPLADMGDYPGMVETRFVQREDDYFIVYLSAQTGCNKGCRMCHLTQTAQTAFIDVTPDALLAQADTILSHYDERIAGGGVSADRVHFNFMARGEPLASQVLLTNGDMIVAELETRAQSRRLRSSVKVSTIMPAEMADRELVEVFRYTKPDIYYSLYSTNHAFRRRWLPRALPVEASLMKLANWQQETSLVPRLHWAFIAGENDSESDVAAVLDAVAAAGLVVRVNVVRYNPPGERFGVEPADEVVDARAAQMLAAPQVLSVRVVPRVGFDVKASCGMFVGGREVR